MKIHSAWRGSIGRLNIRGWGLCKAATVPRGGLVSCLGLGNRRRRNYGNIVFRNDYLWSCTESIGALDVTLTRRSSLVVKLEIRTVITWGGQLRPGWGVGIWFYGVRWQCENRSDGSATLALASPT